MPGWPQFVIPCYLEGRGEPAEGSIPCFLWGSNLPSGQMATLPLFMSGDNSYQDAIPLFAKAPDRDSGSDSITLFVDGNYANVADFIPLYLAQSGTSSSIPLYLRVDNGFVDGAIPVSGITFIHLERPSTACLPLFLRAPGTENSGMLPLFIYGKELFSDGIPLSTSGIGYSTSELPLFVRGF